MLYGPESIQRVQVSLRGMCRRTVPHAVVRPSQQFHAPQGTFNRLERPRLNGFLNSWLLKENQLLDSVASVRVRAHNRTE